MECTHLVLVGCPHILDDLLALSFRKTALLRDDLSENSVDLASHVGSVTANVEVSLLLQKLVDLLGALLETVLDIDLLGALTRESGHELEVITENLLGLLLCMR